MLAPERLLPSAEIKHILVHLRNFARAGDYLLETGAGPHVMAHQLIVRIGTLDRLAKRADDPAIGDMQLHPLSRFGRTEIGGTDFDDRRRGGTTAEEGLIPIDTVAIVAQKKIRFFDA